MVYIIYLFLILINTADELCNQLSKLSRAEASDGFALDIDCKSLLQHKKTVNITFRIVIPHNMLKITAQTHEQSHN